MKSGSRTFMETCKLMDANVSAIAAVIVLVVILIVYLIRQNQKDKAEVTQHFLDDATPVDKEESEANNER